MQKTDSTRAILLIAFVAIFCSCGGVRKAKTDLLYLRQGQLDSFPNLVVPVKEQRMQKNDILQIVVYSDDPDATAIYNRAQGGISLNKGSEGLATGSSTQSANSTNSGYIVDPLGNIRMPGIGVLHVEGLTKLELSDVLTKKFSPYLKNPYFDIKLLNGKVTILGEVQKPGAFSMPDESLNVLELIGLAGDLTIYGNRENILVIREDQGKRSFGRLDLRKADIFQSPFYYLQTNDVVVIEPNAKKQTATEVDNMRKLTLVSALATLVSTVSILVTLFRK